MAIVLQLVPCSRLDVTMSTRKTAKNTPMSIDAISPTIIFVRLTAIATVRPASSLQMTSSGVICLDTANTVAEAD